MPVGLRTAATGNPHQYFTMLNNIHRHLEAIENLQADLEARIQQALGDVSPEEILSRTDELPQEIADELASWIEQHMLQSLVDESVRFLKDAGFDAEDVEEDDEDRVRALVGLLLDHYKLTVVALVTAVFTDIQNRATLQEGLGRSREVIVAELSDEKAGVGSKLKALLRSLVGATDSFISSAGGVVMIARYSGELTWVTVEDKRVCVDCAGLHGASHTPAAWIEFGLPRTGWSVCGGACRCMLMPTVAFKRAGEFGPVVRKRRS